MIKDWQPNNVRTKASNQSIINRAGQPAHNPNKPMNNSTDTQDILTAEEKLQIKIETAISGMTLQYQARLSVHYKHSSEDRSRMDREYSSTRFDQLLDEYVCNIQWLVDKTEPADLRNMMRELAITMSNDHEQGLEDRRAWLDHIIELESQD
jgi:hypothetical protein